IPRAPRTARRGRRLITSRHRSPAHPQAHYEFCRPSVDSAGLTSSSCKPCTIAARPAASVLVDHSCVAWQALCTGLTYGGTTNELVIEGTDFSVRVCRLGLGNFFGCPKRFTCGGSEEAGGSGQATDRARKKEARVAAKGVGPRKGAPGIRGTAEWPLAQYEFVRRPALRL